MNFKIIFALMVMSSLGVHAGYKEKQTRTGVYGIKPHGGQYGVRGIAKRTPPKTASSRIQTVNLTEYFEKNRDKYSTFAAYLKEYNILPNLDEEGDFTILAPTNAAFEKAKNKLGKLSGAEMRELIRSHVIRGKKIDKKDLTRGGEIMTLSKPISKDKLRFTGNVITLQKGKIHPLDEVILP